MAQLILSVRAPSTPTWESCLKGIWPDLSWYAGRIIGLNASFFYYFLAKQIKPKICLDVYITFLLAFVSPFPTAAFCTDGLSHSYAPFVANGSISFSDRAAWATVA